MLTSPYAYDRALAFAVERAQNANVLLNVVFLIDPNAIDAMVRDLGEKGWLGGGSQQTLFESMLEGYGALATDTIETVHRRLADASVSLKTSIRQASLETLLEELLREKPRRVIVSASKSMYRPSQIHDGRLKWIDEERS
ncbi:hypothetical protein POG22_20275 [Geitlerinema sp. CS-897]|nr:hypothetical protein [Geitlerinema sp. CS-897]